MKFLLLLAVLLTSNSFRLSAQEMSFEKTLDNINTRITTWAAKGNAVLVTASRNGDIIISNQRKQTLRFNIFDLLNLTLDKSDETKGIELEYCDRRTHAPSTWINFNTDKGTVAFIRLECNTHVEELSKIYDDFIQLKSFCTKEFY